MVIVIKSLQWGMDAPAMTGTIARFDRGLRDLVQTAGGCGGVVIAPIRRRCGTLSAYGGGEGLKEVGEMLTHVVTHMATKEDIAGVNDRLDKIETRLGSLESEVAAIRRDLDDLRERVENVLGFRKEIDHALERIGAIEKHLGIDKKIAA